MKNIDFTDFFNVFLSGATIICLAFFAVTFAIYFFNLDMKLTSAMQPILDHFYDKVDRDQHL